MVRVFRQAARATALAIGITMLGSACYSWHVESARPLEGLSHGRDARLTLRDGSCLVVQSAALVGQSVSGYGDAQEIVVVPAKYVRRTEFPHLDPVKTGALVIGVSGVALGLVTLVVAATLPSCMMGSC